MLSSGDIVDLQLGIPEGSEAGFRHPAVVVTSTVVLEQGPSVVHVVPLTTTGRHYRSEIGIEPDEANELDSRSYAQCQHIRAVATSRVVRTRGNVGPVVLAQIREILGLILDILR